MKLNVHNIGDEGVMIFRKDKKYQDKEYSTYSICVSQFDKDHNTNKKYMRIYFKKGVSVANQTIIYIKKAFFGFDNKDWYLHVSEFDILKTGCDQVLNGEKPKDLKDEMKFL